MKVLFTFDSKFVTTFGAAAMDKIIALVKNAYKDKMGSKYIMSTNLTKKHDNISF